MMRAAEWARRLLRRPGRAPAVRPADPLPAAGAEAPLDCAHRHDLEDRTRDLSNHQYRPRHLRDVSAGAGVDALPVAPEGWQQWWVVNRGGHWGPS